MIANERPSEILCTGEVPIEAAFACVEPNCTSHGMLCGRKTCECMRQHRGHSMLLLDGLDDTLSAPIALPQNYVRLEKGVNGTIDRWIAELQ